MSHARRPSNEPTPPLGRPDYGIDAPGVRRGMAIGGLVGLLVAGLGTRAPFGPALSAVGGLVAVYGLGMSTYMTRSSRVGKLKTRERMLDLAEELSPWTGDEAVLDVGCGRGLLMVGAARRLTTGRSVGVDLWRAEDQSENRPEAVIENARLEGVSDRVRVETGDMRRLPFDDASFNVVLSHWAVHNLDERSDRINALDEMVRVLRPGGTLVIADIANREETRSHLTGRDLEDLRLDSGGPHSATIGFLSGGSFRPFVVSGRAPGLPKL